MDILNSEEIIMSKVFNAFPLEKFNMTILNFTNSDVSKSGVSEFPTVYMHEMSGIETGTNLECELDAKIVTFEVTVSDNKSQERVKNISNELVKIFKKQLFEVIAFPIYSTLNDVYTSSMRFRRVVDTKDRM